ncbi:SsgA family sporulation/cell division regulator [Streptomyces sp. V4-01]|uniref:SsgA family sporulation/cell division regulator n=1 Tax=Actinacidiphila polyblastidii TaxID=3110430 RepID=A0ABU7PCI4_9ACTN|nr:SsgA family sporulation/cell division regulator [Streptomyces sp. V4-01]
MSHDLPDVPAGRRPSARTTLLSLRVHWIVHPRNRVPMRADFRYDPGAPLIVSLDLHPPQEASLTWEISRDLLYEGVLGPSGTGDVRVWPVSGSARPAVFLRLSHGNAAALFEIGRIGLEDWLHETYDLVPPGTELDGLDWDAAAAELSADR